MTEQRLVNNEESDHNVLKSKTHFDQDSLTMLSTLYADTNMVIYTYL